jgi:hypothetical protein
MNPDRSFAPSRDYPSGSSAPRGDIEKKIDDLQTKLQRLESRYSQSNPSDVMEIRALKQEIKRLQVLLADEKISKN